MRPYAILSRAAAAARAREQGRDDPILDDPQAAAAAGADGVRLLNELDGLHPGDPTAVNPLAVRARFLDDFARAVLAASPIAQVVLIAPAFDTRADRIDWPAAARLFLLDDPEDLEDRRALGPPLRRHGAAIPVAGRLGTPWPEALATAGFDPTATSLWLLEGVLIGLDEGGVHHLLHHLAALAAPGSHLGLDVIGRSTLAMPPLGPALAHLRTLGVGWRFGHDQPERLLATYGWRAEVTQLGDAAVTYGRADGPMPPRGLPGVPREFLVTAHRRGG